MRAAEPRLTKDRFSRSISQAPNVSSRSRPARSMSIERAPACRRRASSIRRSSSAARHRPGAGRDERDVIALGRGGKRGGAHRVLSGEGAAAAREP